MTPHGGIISIGWKNSRVLSGLGGPVSKGDCNNGVPAQIGREANGKQGVHVRRGNDTDTLPDFHCPTCGNQWANGQTNNVSSVWNRGNVAAQYFGQSTVIRRGNPSQINPQHLT